MTQLFANGARAELAASINGTDTSLTIVSGGSLFPVANTGASAIGPAADWYKLTLQDDAGFEIVFVRTHTAGSLTFSNLMRGQEGTVARAFTGPTVVGLRQTAGDADVAVAKEPAIASGTTVQYWRGDKTWRDLATDVRAAVLTGLSTASSAAITATDSVLSALGKLQKQITDAVATLATKAPTANPTFTGTVSGVTKAHVGLGSVDNTSDAAKPVSAATQTALDLKAPLASPTFTGTVGGVTKAMVGLGSVDNVSAASLRDRTTHTGAQAISTVTNLQASLDAKAPTASPTFTGTVTGVTKAMVGLGSVDNTSDAAKPISTATQTALDAKAPTASPTFTGTVAVPAITGNDSAATRLMLKDTGFVYFDSNTTSALNYTNGSHQRWAPSGSATLSVLNWPPSGNLGELLIEGVNLGAATLTLPTISWVLSDGTTSTTFADTEVALQASGVDWILLWTRDAGTTVYGKVMR